MRNLAVFSCFGLAIVLGAISHHMLGPGNTAAMYQRAHNEVERIAFSEGGSEALKKAVTDERLAMKGLSLSRETARLLIGASVIMTIVGILLSVLVPKREKSNQAPQTFAE